MEKRKLKVGMIGVGDITPLHFNGYQGCDFAEVHRICDLNEALLRSRSREWGVERATTDYRELLDDPEVDIVEVNTPHDTHAGLVIAALDAGKHVSCQKPMSVSLRQGQEMIAAAARNPGRLRVLENFVFYPPYVRARELMAAGEIGEILSIRFKLGPSMFGSRWIPIRTNLWRLPESDKGMGWAVFDDGYHKLSVAIHFFGAIESVKGFIDRSFGYIDVPAQLIWRYKGRSTLGSWDISFAPNLYTESKYFSADERIDIVGTRGMITLTRCTGQIVNEPPLILYRDGKRFLFEDIEADWQASFTAGIRDFPMAILENRETLISPERAQEITRFAYALTISARAGVEVRPDEVTDQMIGEVFPRRGAAGAGAGR
jgi:predicted dehydrogenase